MILGMDWLESLPPMWIDWTKKTIRYKSDGKRVQLRGVRVNAKSCTPVSMEELNLMAADREIEQIMQLCLLPDGGLTEALPVDIAQVL
jgi:hypothetical protein